MEQEITRPYEGVGADVAGVFRAVYGWMAGGLLLTALASYITINSPFLLQAIFGNRMVFYGLIIGELLLVMSISGAINRLGSAAGAGLFLFYSLLNGVTLSAVFLIYTRSSIASAFVVTAGTFGVMSLYGYATKKDLSSWGSFLFMGLVGVVIASIVNIFMHSEMIYWVSTFCGVIVFTGLAAYDTFKIKAMAQMATDSESMKRIAILGALNLYLDFINLFLMMLRLMGRRQ